MGQNTLCHLTQVWSGTGLICAAPIGPLPSPWSRLIPSQRDQLFLGPKPPGRLLSALHTAPPGKASWGTRPLSLEALMPPGKGLQAVLPDIFGVLATQKFLERGKGSGIFIMFGFLLLLVFS